MADNISINFFLKILRRFWWLILAVTILVMVGTGVYTDRYVTKQYSSSVQFMVWNENADPSNSNLNGADRIANDYIVVIKGEKSRTQIQHAVMLRELENKDVNLSRLFMQKIKNRNITLSEKDIAELEECGVKTNVSLDGTGRGSSSIDLAAALGLWNLDFDVLAEDGSVDHEVSMESILNDAFADYGIAPVKSLSNMIRSATNADNSSFILSVVGTNPNRVFLIAQVIGDVMPTIIAENYPSINTNTIRPGTIISTIGPDGTVVTGVVEANAEVIRLKVVEPASGAGLSSPNVEKNVTMAGVISAVAMYGVCFLIAFCNTTIRTPEDVVEKLGQAPLGVCPTWNHDDGKKGEDEGDGKAKKKKAKKAIPDPDKKEEEEERRALTSDTPFAIREGFNQLRTNLMYVPKEEGGCPVYAVTSVDVGTGKSTISANVAISFANISKKVLLIDADLRCPVQFRTFHEKKNRKGLSELLSGIETDDKTAIKPSSIPNLDLLTSGQIPPNPSELVSSDRFVKLLDKWRKEYDVIFVDLPPVGIVNDPMAICGSVTGYIFVVRSARDSAKKVRFAISETEKIGGKVVGVVLNDVDPKGHIFGGGYYGSYYGSQYGKYSKYSKYSKYDKYKYSRYGRYSRYAKYAKYAKYAQYEQSHEAVRERLRQEQAQNEARQKADSTKKD